MIDTRALLAEVEALQASGRPLDTLSPALLADYLQSPGVVAALQRLDCADWSLAESGGFADGARAAPLAAPEFPGWRALLLRHVKPPTLARTAARRTLLAPVRVAEGAVFRRYAIAGDLSSSTFAADWRVTRFADVPASAGALFASEAPDVAFGLAGATSDAVVLMLEGAQVASASHAFDLESGAYLSTLLADAEATSRHLFAEMVKQLSADVGFRAALAPEETARVCDLLEHGAGEESGAAASRWLMLQAVSKLDPSRTRPLLERLASGRDSYLAAQAARLLAPKAPA